MVAGGAPALPHPPRAPLERFAPSVVIMIKRKKDRSKKDKKFGLGGTILFSQKKLSFEKKNVEAGGLPLPRTPPVRRSSASPFR